MNIRKAWPVLQAYHFSRWGYIVARVAVDADKLRHSAGVPVWSDDLLQMSSDDSGQSDSDFNIAKVVVELQVASQS
jgi:hypothetical protein